MRGRHRREMTRWLRVLGVESHKVNVADDTRLAGQSYRSSKGPSQRNQDQSLAQPSRHFDRDREKPCKSRYSTSTELSSVLESRWNERQYRSRSCRLSSRPASMGGARGSAVSARLGRDGGRPRPDTPDYRLRQPVRVIVFQGPPRGNLGVVTQSDKPLKRLDSP